MKRLLALTVALLSLVACQAAAQAGDSIFIARLDSTHDEMTGRTSYRVQMTSRDTTKWTYGWVAANLMLRCSSDAKDPKWWVGSGATPKHTYGRDPSLGVLQMKTDGEDVREVSAEHREAGRFHFLILVDNKGFTKRVMASKTLTLRWALLTNEVVTFHYDMTTFVPLIPHLYERCGKDVPT